MLVIYFSNTIIFDEDISEEVQAESIGSQTSFYSIVMKNGDAFTLTVEVDLYAVHQVTDVLWSIFPYFIFIAFMLSVLCSAFYANHITRTYLERSIVQTIPATEEQEQQEIFFIKI